MSGSSNDFFDFNHDGKLDALEWSAKMEFMDEVSKDHSEYHGETAGASRSRKTGSGGRVQRTAGSGSRVQRTAGSERPAQRKKNAASAPGEEQDENVIIHPAFGIFLKMILAFICLLLVYSSALKNNRRILVFLNMSLPGKPGACSFSLDNRFLYSLLRRGPSALF